MLDFRFPGNTQLRGYDYPQICLFEVIILFNSAIKFDSALDDPACRCSCILLLLKLGNVCYRTTISMLISSVGIIDILILDVKF
jgi:hypothetical protein